MKKKIAEFQNVNASENINASVNAMHVESRDIITGNASHFLGTGTNAKDAHILNVLTGNVKEISVRATKDALTLNAKISPTRKETNANTFVIIFNASDMKEEFKKHAGKSAFVCKGQEIRMLTRIVTLNADFPCKYVHCKEYFPNVGRGEIETEKISGQKYGFVPDGTCAGIKIRFQK